MDCFLGPFEFLKAVSGHLDERGFPGIFFGHEWKNLMAAFSLPIFLEISPPRYRILASDNWVPLKSPVEYDASYSSMANLKIFLLVPCFGFILYNQAIRKQIPARIIGFSFFKAPQ